LTPYPSGGKGSSTQEPEFLRNFFFLEFSMSRINADNFQVVSWEFGDVVENMHFEVEGQARGRFARAG